MGTEAFGGIEPNRIKIKPLRITYLKGKWKKKVNVLKSNEGYGNVWNGQKGKKSNSKKYLEFYLASLINFTFRHLFLARSGLQLNMFSIRSVSDLIDQSIF